MNTIISWCFWRDAILTNGLPPDNRDLELRRKLAIINACCILTVIVLLFMAVTAFYNGNTVVVTADSTLALILFSVFFYLRKTKNFYNTALISLFFTGMLLFYPFISGGVKGTGQHFNTRFTTGDGSILFTPYWSNFFLDIRPCSHLLRLIYTCFQDTVLYCLCHYSSLYLSFFTDYLHQDEKEILVSRYKDRQNGMGFAHK